MHKNSPWPLSARSVFNITDEGRRSRLLLYLITTYTPTIALAFFLFPSSSVLFSIMLIARCYLWIICWQLKNYFTCPNSLCYIKCWNLASLSAIYYSFTSCMIRISLANFNFCRICNIAPVIYPIAINSSTRAFT